MILAVVEKLSQKLLLKTLPLKCIESKIIENKKKKYFELPLFDQMVNLAS